MHIVVHVILHAALLSVIAAGSAHRVGCCFERLGDPAPWVVQRKISPFTGLITAVSLSGLQACTVQVLARCLCSYPQALPL